MSSSQNRQLSFSSRQHVEHHTAEGSGNMKKQSLDCVKFLVANSKSLASHDISMFCSTVDCLLDPLYEVVDLRLKKSHNQSINDLMPGSGNTARGGTSLGTAFASRDNDCFGDGGCPVVPNDDVCNDPMRISDVEFTDGGGTSLGTAFASRQTDLDRNDVCVAMNNGFDNMFDDDGISIVPTMTTTMNQDSSSTTSTSKASSITTQEVSLPQNTIAHARKNDMKHISGGVRIGVCGEKLLRSQTVSRDIAKMIQSSISSATPLMIGEQSLVTFQQPELFQQNQMKVIDPTLIIGYLSVQRNVKGQIYLQQDLDRSGHGTIPTRDDKKFISIKLNDNEVPYVIIPNTANYISDDSKLVVINMEENLPHGLNVTAGTDTSRPIETCTDIITNMFELGMAECFVYDNKKRSNVNDTVGKVKTSRRKRKTSSKPEGPRKSPSHAVDKDIPTPKQHCVLKPIPNQIKVRTNSNYQGKSNTTVTVDIQALPTITMGWTQLDTNQYSTNKTTVAGSIKPFLRKGNVPKKVCMKTIELVEFVLQVLPGDWAFNVNKEKDSIILSHRKQMMKEFKQYLGGDRDIRNFRVEGITILIPISIGYHKDTLNCFAEGMRSVVSVNCQVPFNVKSLPGGKGSKLWVWLKANGYTDTFPCSIILYSRVCVHRVCNKMKHAADFASKDMVRKVIDWGLTQRVGSVVDYKARVFDNDSFPSIFNIHAKRSKKKNHFKGLMLSTPAAYDKMVSVFVNWNVNPLLHFSHTSTFKYHSVITLLFYTYSLTSMSTSR